MKIKEFGMKNKNFWLGMLVIVLVFGMTVVGCDLFKEEDFSGTINGVWHLVDNSKNKTGTIITINGNVGTLTVIGEDDEFKYYSDRGQMNIGDTVLKNISFKGEWKDDEDTIYWACEFIFEGIFITELEWNKTYISYNKKEKDYMFVYTFGDPDFGMGYRFKK